MTHFVNLPRKRIKDAAALTSAIETVEKRAKTRLLNPADIAPIEATRKRLARKLGVKLADVTAYGNPESGVPYPGAYKGRPESTQFIISGDKLRITRTYDTRSTCFVVKPPANTKAPRVDGFKTAHRKRLLYARGRDSMGLQMMPERTETGNHRGLRYAIRYHGDGTATLAVTGAIHVNAARIVRRLRAWLDSIAG